MKNYICFNGEKVELSAAQVAKIKNAIGLGQTKLKSVPVGECFKIGEHEFIVLEQSGDTVAVILKNLLYDEKQFGKNNNFENSDVDKICEKFGREIANVIGKENLVEHTVDLTSDDGLKDYGKIKRKMSLFTAELYRRYVEILDKYKIDKWWWIATAFSTPTHGTSTWIKCVSPDGSVDLNDCDDVIGVRPFCILNSDIFVSIKE